MSERQLRGSRLGTSSLENDDNVEPAPRQMVEYVCPQGHHQIVPMSVEADVPPVWECRCGEEALRVDGERPVAKPGRPQRTHWDMLLERRTVAELEVLLEERLALLRSGALRSKRSA
jgi:hypothetical protein